MKNSGNVVTSAKNRAIKESRTNNAVKIYVKNIEKNDIKGSDQRKNRWVWSNVNTRYLVWRCGDGGSFAL